MLFQNKCKSGIILLFALLLFTVPVTADSQQISISTVVSDVYIIADSNVADLGYLVNGVSSVTRLPVGPGGEVMISLSSPVDGIQLRVLLDGDAAQELTAHSVRVHTIVSEKLIIYLSLEKTSDVIPKPNIRPSWINPNVPDVPDTPSEPENPDTPDTPGSDEPGSDEPGSDEPYTPILPPAGIVYNIAGFASLAAGFLLLFLLLFMRGNLVYRTLKKHAKEHGEKPDKEEKKHLKEIASAVVSRIKDDEKYPEWKKNSDVMKHLGVDICLLLDEMKYREAVPREALVTEILEKARGKINRHRL